LARGDHIFQTIDLPRPCPGIIMIFLIRLNFIHGQCSHSVRTPDLHGQCCMLYVHPGPQAVRLEAISERPTHDSYYRMLILECLYISLSCSRCPGISYVLVSGLKPRHLLTKFFCSPCTHAPQNAHECVDGCQDEEEASRR
jgi:hypothetical protein